MRKNELYKTYKRMCNSYTNSSGCPLHFLENCDLIDIVRIVKNWTKEHPINQEGVKENGND